MRGSPADAEHVFELHRVWPSYISGRGRVCARQDDRGDVYQSDSLGYFRVCNFLDPIKDEPCFLSVHHWL